MVLDLPGGLFEQTDVRETNTSQTEQSNYNSDDFTVASGVVSLKNKTSYWSCPGNAFRPSAPSQHNVGLTIGGDIGVCSNQGGAGTFTLIAPVFLPHGAVITGAIVYCSEIITWKLTRRTTSTASTISVLATANTETEDTTITNATVDNSLYSYWITVQSLASEEEIHGARVTYTTDYD